MMITTRKYPAKRLKKLALIGLVIGFILFLSIFTILSDSPPVVDIQADSDRLTIQHSIEDFFQIAVNWGSHPQNDPLPPSIDSVADVNWGSSPLVNPPPSISPGAIGAPEESKAAEGGVEIADVNWGSSPLVNPPPPISTFVVSEGDGKV